MQAEKEAVKIYRGLEYMRLDRSKPLLVCFRHADATLIANEAPGLYIPLSSIMKVML